MVNAVVAVIAMFFLLLLYGALMLFTDYIKVAPYLKVMFINGIWFLLATGYKEYDIYYPTVFDNKWLNLFLMSIGLLLLTFEISKFIKLRNALIISAGALTHIVIAAFIVNVCGGFPGWVTAVYLTVSSCIVLAIHLSAIYGGKNTAPSGLFSRLLAGILMMPGPGLITSACMLSLSIDNGKSIELMSFSDFVNSVIEFLGDPDFNFSGKLMFTGAVYTRQMFIASLLVALIAFVLYIVIDSTVDYRSEVKERSKHRKEAEKERVRAEISSRIHAQLEKIDSCMAYISANYKTLKVREDDMSNLRKYYDEATRIKYSYNGAASGSILKRITELKTEIFVIRDRILNDHYGEPDYEEKMKSEFRYEEAQNKQEKTEEPKKKTSTTGYFNGCKTEEEIKKRYRDLCKVFHPDSENGDQETFLKVKEDYEQLMGKEEPAHAS